MWFETVDTYGLQGDGEERLGEAVGDAEEERRGQFEGIERRRGWVKEEKPARYVSEPAKHVSRYVQCIASLLGVPKYLCRFWECP